MWPEQGLGDEIMFCSILSELHSQADSVIVQTDKRLVQLFQRSFPQDVKFVPREQTVKEEDYDLHIPMGSLPRVFRPTLESFEIGAKKFFKADSKRAENLRSELLDEGCDKLIGISWHSTAKRSLAREKGISLEQLAKTLNKPGTKLISLQYGDVSKEIADLKNTTGITVTEVSEIDNYNDIDGLAALIEACDEVVSISNVTVHIAGALGKPVKILLASSCDWRWGSKQDYSYWYQDAKLYRQSEINNWENVLKMLGT